MLLCELQLLPLSKVIAAPPSLAMTKLSESAGLIHRSWKSPCVPESVSHVLPPSLERSAGALST